MDLKQHIIFISEQLISSKRKVILWLFLATCISAQCMLESNLSYHLSLSLWVLSDTYGETIQINE